MGRPTLILALITLLLFVGACGDESTNPTQPQQIDVAFTGHAPMAPWGWAPTALEILERLDYEEIQGSIVPGQAGFLYGVLTTWPGACHFAIQVPPGALPDNGGNPVTFAIRVPTYQSYMDHSHLNGGLGLPLTMELEPSELVFLEPVVVYATYMPWVETTPIIEDWSLWTGEPDVEYFDLQSVVRNKNIFSISFEAPHFSRWESGGGLPDK